MKMTRGEAKEELSWRSDPNQVKNRSVKEEWQSSDVEAVPKPM